MEIVKLPIGERAPADSDCISLDPADDGMVRMTGSLLVGEESMAIVDGPTYASLEEAEAAGTAWAADNGIAKLYISTAGKPGAPA